MSKFTCAMLSLACLLMSGAVSAEDFFKDWRIVEQPSDSTVIAVTENQYNKKLSFVNEAGELYYLAGPFGACAPGSEVNVLLTDGKGSLVSRGECKMIQGPSTPIYFVRFNGGEIDTLLGEKGVLKLAVPSQDSMFEFTAFSLLGSSQAVAEAQRRELPLLEPIQ